MSPLVSAILDAQLTWVPVMGQLWSIATTSLQVRLRMQLNSILFAKTLVRKDIASSAATSDDAEKKTKAAEGDDAKEPENSDDDEFSSKAQIMTLMTTDVDRVSEFSWHLFTLVGKLEDVNLFLQY